MRNGKAEREAQRWETEQGGVWGMASDLVSFFFSESRPSGDAREDFVRRGSASGFVRVSHSRKLKQMWVGSEDLGGSNSLKPPLVELRHRDPKTVYEPIGVEQVLKMERAERIIETWRRYYEGDPVHRGCIRCDCFRSFFLCAGFRDA